MLVRIFKSNQVYIYAFIPLVLLALRWPALLGDPPFTSSGQLPLLHDFFAWLSMHPWLSILFSVIAITFQAYTISEFSNEHRLIPFSTNFMAFFLAISYSVFAPHAWFSPVIFANVFSVMALKRIIRIFHQGEIKGSLFRAGIYISIATLIYLPSIYMLLIIYYALAIIRTFNWREFAIVLIGLMTPYLYILIYYYLNFEGDIFFNYFIEPKTFLSFLEFEWMNWIPGIIVGLLSINSLLYLFATGNKRTVRENNLFKIITVSFLLTVLLSVIFQKDFMSAVALIWPCLSILISYYILGLSRRWLQEGLIIILLVAIFSRDIIEVLYNN